VVVPGQPDPVSTRQRWQWQKSDGFFGPQFRDRETARRWHRRMRRAVKAAFPTLTTIGPNAASIRYIQEVG
jgi:hypothetical protein